MSVPNVVTCLSPWGQAGATPLGRARIARPRFAACGLDRMSSARQGLAMPVSTNGNVSFLFGTAIVPPRAISMPLLAANNRKRIVLRLTRACGRFLGSA
jgi:hypothetical protein